MGKLANPINIMRELGSGRVEQLARERGSDTFID